MKRLCIVIAVLLIFTLTLSACSSKADAPAAAPAETAVDTPSEPANDEPVEVAGGFTVAMVTDVGGINDQCFNQGAWEGLQKLQADGIADDVKYLESKQESDYSQNLDRFADAGIDVIWGIGFMMADAILNAAKVNPDNTYAIVDMAFGPDTPDNVICLVFDSQDCSFLVGYIAGMVTETNKVGVVGGIKGDLIDTFEFGYRGGVQYAAKERGVDIEVLVQYADSFTDAAKGKTIATTMYQNGADIVFQAAGGVGVGVIEAAKELDKWAIGADVDQNYLAPDNVLTSAMKYVNQGIYNVVSDLVAGKNLGGSIISGTLENGSVGYSPSSDKFVPADILAKTDDVKAKLISGELTAPINEGTYNEFVAGL